mmetsp:Transcript_80285/g.250347  ORF Transcript_80285/g.250347 Transcript_80285/m.250347 type:complete len:441 (+) Transcript_80285:933-2255(+)
MLQRSVRVVPLENEVTAVPDLPQNRHVETPHLRPDLPWNCCRGADAHSLQGEVVVAEVAAEVGPEVCPLGLVGILGDEPVEARGPEAHGLRDLAAGHRPGQGAEAPAVQQPQVLVDEDLLLLQDPLQHMRRRRTQAQADEALEVGLQVALVRQRPEQDHARVCGVRIEERLGYADHEPVGAEDLDGHNHLQKGEDKLEETPGAALRQRHGVPQGHVVLALQRGGVSELAEDHVDVGQQDAPGARVFANRPAEGIRAQLHAVALVAGTPVRDAQNQVGGEHAAEAESGAPVALGRQQDNARDDVHKGLQGKSHEFDALLHPQQVPLARGSLEADVQELKEEVPALCERRPEGLNPPLECLLITMEVRQGTPDLRCLRALPDIEVVAPYHSVPVVVGPQHPRRQPLVVRGTVVGHPLAHPEDSVRPGLDADLVAVGCLEFGA